MLPVPPPPSAVPALPGRVNRRTLFKLGGVSALLLAGGVWVSRTIGRFGPPGAGLQVFDADEFVVLQQVCDAAFPGTEELPLSAADVKTAEFIDAYVGGLYDDQQLLFRALVRTVNLSTVLSSAASFRWLPRAQRQAALEEWRTSHLQVRRSGHQALMALVNMGYFEDDRVREAAGFKPGCDLSGRPRAVGQLH